MSIPVMKFWLRRSLMTAVVVASGAVALAGMTSSAEAQYYYPYYGYPYYAQPYYPYPAYGYGYGYPYYGPTVGFTFGFGGHHRRW
jgi:hypothetical protein